MPRPIVKRIHQIRCLQKVPRQLMAMTHRATRDIQYGAWMDNSTDVRGLGQFRVVKIALEKDYEYHDEETYQSFQYQRVHFRRSNDFDRYQSYTEHYVVPGYTDFALCCRHGERPACLHLCYYTLCSLFMLSHPYRVWMEKISVKTDIHICKRVSANPMAMQQLPLVMQYETAADLAVQTAVVYQVGVVNRYQPCGALYVRDMVTIDVKAAATHSDSTTRSHELCVNSLSSAFAGVIWCSATQHTHCCRSSSACGHCDRRRTHGLCGAGFSP